MIFFLTTMFPHMFFYRFLSKIIFVEFFFSYWVGWKFSFVVFFFKTPLIAKVFPHMIFFVMIFFKIIFIDFIVFNIELVDNYNCRFSHETLDCYSVFLHSFFFLSFFYDFFQNYLYWFYFFNIDLVENYNCIFPHKTL